MKKTWLGVLLLCVGVLSCKKEEVTRTREPGSYGAQTTSDAINKALMQEAGRLNPYVMQLGEYAQREQYQELDGQNRTILMDQGDTVVNIKEASGCQFVSIVRHQIFYSKEPRKISREFEDAFCQDTASEEMLKALSVSAAVQKSNPTVATAAASNDVTFHNLKTVNSVVAPPEAVRSQPNCGGVPQCQLNVNTVMWDEVDWTASETGSKMHYEISFSPDVPYQAGVYNICIATVLPTEKSQVIVSQCTPVTNFKYKE